MSARAADLAKGFTARALSIEQTVIDSAEGGVRWTVELEHTGDYLGLPASGRVSRVSGSAAVRFKDGKIDYWVEVIDLMGLVRDLGGWSIPLRGCYPSQ